MAGATGSPGTLHRAPAPGTLDPVRQDEVPVPVPARTPDVQLQGDTRRNGHGPQGGDLVPAGDRYIGDPVPGIPEPADLDQRHPPVVVGDEVKRHDGPLRVHRHDQAPQGCSIPLRFIDGHVGRVSPRHRASPRYSRDGRGFGWQDTTPATHVCRVERGVSGSLFFVPCWMSSAWQPTAAIARCRCAVVS